MSFHFLPYELKLSNECMLLFLASVEMQYSEEHDGKSSREDTVLQLVQLALPLAHAFSPQSLAVA